MIKLNPWQIAFFLVIAAGCIPSGQVSGVSPTPAPASPATVATTPSNSTPSSAPNSPSDAESAGGDIVAQAADCTNPQTQLEINECAAKSADVADQKLNEVYQQLKATLSSSEEKLLTDAQRAWIEFRDKNCAFSSGRFEGGSIAPTVYSSCIERITKQRTEELQGYAQSMEDGGLF
ncbi:MAG: lysozyme inhibitor LprI family protein [Oculatellaceae cyanobacterium bins.114]|nr:lysozyme inhibitor LprI family protein [Oculatellaceae cyanobacterium bins.114]